MMKNFRIIFTIAFAAATILSCKDDDPAEGPAGLNDVQFFPMAGAGYFKYSIPSDPSFVYAKAVYQLDKGTVIAKSSSKYSDSLYIDGFLEEKEYEIQLYTVNAHDVGTLSQTIHVKPYASPIHEVANSITVNAGVSSVYIDVSNPSSQKTIVYLTLKSEGSEDIVKAYVSDRPACRFVITPLENKSYTATVFTTDLYENRTDDRELGAVEPQMDVILPKKKWKLLEDEFVPDALIEPGQYIYKKNAAKAFYEGRIEHLWDDIIDRGSTPDYFNAGCVPPYSYYLDFGQPLRISRITTWPRRFYVEPWGIYQISEYELYGSNTVGSDGIVTDWFFIRRCNIVKPDSEAEAAKEVEDGSTFYLYPDTYGFSPPIRYLRLRVVRLFVNADQSFFSEMTLHGMQE